MLNGKINSILRVSGTSIVDGSGQTVILKGASLFQVSINKRFEKANSISQAALGGHMNMENFITGFSGHERQHRAALLEVLGKEKYDVFFDTASNTSFHSTPRKYIIN